MKFWQGALLWVGASLLFLVANRGAYQGYFSDDDLDNLAWTRHAAPELFVKGLVTPRQYASNFRPAGHAVYKFLGTEVGLDFRWYVAFIQGAHLLNLLLLWRLLRRLGAPVGAAIAGCFVFGFHMAAFDAFWKPMYVFDVLCALFVLTSLLLYLNDRWLLALIPFWLAYKSKELAVMLPAVLLAYEWMLGEKRWRRVLPFFAIAAMFSVQAFVANRARNDDYTLRFMPEDVIKCVTFYASKVLLAPYLGFLLIPLAWLVKDRRVRFGLLALVLFLGPLLFLPGRLFSVYLYLPLVGLAVAVAFLFPTRRVATAAAVGLLCVWLMGNYYVLRRERRFALTVAPQNRAYVEGVGQFAKEHPDFRDVILDGSPQAMNVWGAKAAFRWFLPAADLRLVWVEDAEVREMLGKERLAVASWDRSGKQLKFLVREPGTPDQSFIRAGRYAPIWQLTDGWFLPEADFRWMGPVGKARLRHPAGAREFVLTANLSELQIKDQGRVSVEPVLNGRGLGPQWYEHNGWLTLRWPVPQDLAETVDVELRVVPPYHASNGDTRTFGVAVVSFGFPE